MKVQTTSRSPEGDLYAQTKKIMKTKCLFALCLAIGCTIACFSQQKRILVHHLQDQSVSFIDTLPSLPSLDAANTIYFEGTYSDEILNLPEDYPSSNVFEGTQFLQKQPLTADFELSAYPARAAVKIFYVEDGSLKNLCSGMFVSANQILSSAHCVLDFIDNRDSLVRDSILVCPAYNDGIPFSDFDCHYVQKVYHFEQWTLGGEDMTILEIDEMLGMETGWIGIGYNENEEELLENIYYKFSYPNSSVPVGILPFNGDTLYYQYGAIDLINEYYIGITSTVGQPGDSGSSLISVENGESYISYGVATWSTSFRHSKMNNWRYHALKQIIEPNLVSIPEEPPAPSEIILFPNPTSDILTIHLANQNWSNARFRILNAAGAKVRDGYIESTQTEIDLSALASGIYFVVIQHPNGISTRKITKK